MIALTPLFIGKQQTVFNVLFYVHLVAAVNHPGTPIADSVKQLCQFMDTAVCLLQLYAIYFEAVKKRCWQPGSRC